MTLQSTVEGVDYILVDEMSMIGQRLLALMSIRGKQATQGRASEGMGDRQHVLFGGLSIILGDPMQLPPVGAAPIWSSNPDTVGHTVEGLRTEFRRSSGPEQAAYRQAFAWRSTVRRHRGKLEPSRHQNAKERPTPTCQYIRGCCLHFPDQRPR